VKLGVRGKLFLISTSVFVVAISVSGLLLSQTLRENLFARAESELTRHARTAALIVEDAAGIETVAEGDRLADRLGEATSSRITIILEDGAVIGDSEVDLERIPAMKNHARRPEIERAFSEGFGESRRYSTTVEHEMLYVAISLERKGEPVVVRASRPLDEIDAAIDHALFLLVTAGLFGFVVAVAISALTSHYISRSLRTLADHANRLAEGQSDGPLPVSTQDEIGGLAGSLQRLSEQLEGSMAALAAERDRFEAVLEGMREAVVALDDRRRVTLVNRAGVLLLGVTGDPVGRTLLETIRIPELHQLVDDLEPGQEDTSEFDLPGAEDTRVLAHAIRRRSGEHVIVLLDVTELRRLETARRDFVANVSHELRTPMSVIQANAETLLDGAIDDRTAAAKFVETIHANARRLSGLISDLLDISRIEAGKIEPAIESLSVRQALIRTLESVRERAQAKQMTLEVDAPDELGARADAGMLDQILLNLTDNAIKYADAGGRVVLRASARDGRAVLEVEDDGPGIEPAHRERLFERFYRVDAGRSRELGGTGLGLAIVKHLTLAMRGDVGVAPAPERGSIFWISLPISPA
jgi:two-component system phosphate regulon sensor histidine kinase PhoR